MIYVVVLAVGLGAGWVLRGSHVSSSALAEVSKLEALAEKAESIAVADVRAAVARLKKLGGCPENC